MRSVITVGITRPRQRPGPTSSGPVYSTPSNPTHQCGIGCCNNFREERLSDCSGLYRLFLCEVYLQIIAGNEKLPFLGLLKNLPVFLKVMVTAPSRILALITRVLENPQFQGEEKAYPGSSAFDRGEAYPSRFRTNADARAARRGAWLICFLKAGVTGKKT